MRRFFKTPFGITITVILVTIAMQAPLLYRAQGDVTQIFLVGTDRPPPAVAEKFKPFQHPGGGYDGQFYLFAAYDPLLLHPVNSQSFDFPALRLQRIGLPFLAWCLALSHPLAVPWTYWALVIFSSGLLAWVLAKFALTFGKSSLWGLLVPLLLGVQISSMRMLTDAPATACMFAAFYCLNTGKMKTHYLLCALAVLIRETMIVPVAAFAVARMAEEKRLGSILGYLFPALVFFLWKCYIISRLAILGSASVFTPFSHFFVLPGVAFFEKLRMAFVSEGNVWKRMAEIVLVVSLLIGSIYGIFRCIGGKRDFIGIALLLIGGFTVCLGSNILEENWAYGRITLPLVVFALAAYLKDGDRIFGSVACINILYTIFFWLAKMMKDGIPT